MSRTVVIVGGGQASVQVAASLRERSGADRILIIGDEPHAPYQRPPLSKAYLKGELGSDRLYLKPPRFFSESGIELMTGTRVGRIDVRNRRIATASGEEVAYDALIIATGTRPRRPALAGADLTNVFTLRTMADADALRSRLDTITRFVIVGGGYIGLEVAAVLREKGKQVTIVEAEERLLKRVTAEPLSRYFEDLHRSHGVDIITGAKVRAILGETAATAVELEDGRAIAADGVLLAVGAVANAELAEAAGLAVRDGILVDAHGRTSAADIYACGDCAGFPSRRYGRDLRLESVQNAIDQAKCVAAAIAGEPTLYDPVPWFWSDQFGRKLQIAGLSDAGDEVSVEGDPARGSFAIEYRRNGCLVAVDTIDNARAHMLARRRIAEETALRSAATPAAGAGGLTPNHQWRATEPARQAEAMSSVEEAQGVTNEGGQPSPIAGLRSA
jgi:3-phenylpropionate/trans-cinnamate dioxygenase ferredoxin reductase subunit